MTLLDMPTLVAKDLAEWKRWEFVPEFTVLAKEGILKASAYRNGLVYYLLCSKNREPEIPRPLVANEWLHEPLLYFLVVGGALFRRLFHISP
jgi:hypothetical protein